MAIKPVVSNDPQSWIACVWTALENYRADRPGPDYDKEWDEICTSMAWIQEILGVEEEIDDPDSEVQEQNLSGSPDN